MPEIVRVRLHRQAVDAHDDRVFPGGVIVAAAGVGPGQRQHAVGDKILAGTVALDDRLDQVFGHVGVVGQQLLGVFGQAVAAVAKAGVVVVAADARVQADAVDDLFGVKAFHLGVGVQLVKKAHAQRQVGVGEQLDGLGLGKAHIQRVDVLLDGPLLQKPRKGVRGLHQAGVLQVGAHDDAAGVEVVVQGFALAQKLRAEQDVAAAGLLADRGGIPHRDGGLDDEDGVGVHLQHKVDDLLHRRGVKEIFLAVVVRRRGDDHKVGVAVGGAAVQRGHKVQRLFGEVFLDVFVLDGRLAAVDLFHLFGQDIHRRHMVVLRQQRRDGQPHIAGTGHCNVHNAHSLPSR